MVVQAPSVAESRKSFLCYGAFAALLVCGMTLAAVVHDVPGWELPMLMTVALYPSIIYYAHRQATRENEIRARAGALEGLQIVAGGVAHDFNNILTGVLGYAELAQAELAPGHPAREAIDEVVGGTQRASLLSGRLLAFSGNGPASDELLDVDRELRELVALMEPVVPKGIELKLDSRMRGARVRADRAQLQQVVMNLVLNAAEATETRPGSVWVTLDRAGGTGDRGAWLELCVRDQGVGIPRELRPSIFEPFVTSKEGGHGLGLASVRGIMNELGGGIEVRSVEGQGTEIRVRLPVQDQPLASPMPERLPAAPGRGGLALVVDDEERVRTLVARLLRRLGYRVLEAEDAQRALDCFRTRGREIEVVVLDLRMPGMDGWECLEALREIRRDVPVLVCSGYDPGAVEERDDPRLGFLRKPFRIDHLREALDRLAAGVQ
jgi:signal transduction histidine kinase